MSNSIEHMDDRFLRLNLLMTQGIILLIAAIGSYFVHSWDSFYSLWRVPGWTFIMIGILFAVLVVVCSEGIERIVPASWVADGEINQRVFRGLSIFRTALLCILVGLAEEWLFRGVVQWWLGNVWTSLLFTVIHLRYLKKPLLMIMVFGTSYGLGVLFQLQGSLIVPIIAHSLLDFLSALIIQRRR